MAKLDFEAEKNSVDFVTDSMYTLSFLQSISDVIFSEHRHGVTVGRFYDEWLQKSGAPQPKIPFSLGAVVGYLYCGLLLTKQLWYDLIPDDATPLVDADWHLSEITFSFSRDSTPTARHVVGRIRNALGHGNMTIDVPAGLDKSRAMEVVIRFHDENPRDPTDVFHAEATLGTLAKLIRKFQSEIHRHVRTRMQPSEQRQ